MALSQTDWGVVHEEVYAALLPTYLANHPNSSLVLHRLWPLNRKALLLAMVDMHAKDNGTIPRILDVCQELKALTMVLDSTPYSFAIDLAALAARREYLNLEKWLHSSLNARGMPFIAACLGFLRERAATTPEQLQAAGKGTVVPLSVEMMVLFFKVSLICGFRVQSVRLLYKVSCDVGTFSTNHLRIMTM
jgi:CCR4-NOT transcription complex subunit 1